MKISITQEGIYYTLILSAVFIGALIREVNTMLLFASFLAAPLLLTPYVGRKNLKGINVKRIVPSQIFAGKSFTIGLNVSNKRPVKIAAASSWGIIVIDRIRWLGQDETTESSKTYEPAVYFNYIPNGQTRYQSYAGFLPHRGLYQFEKIQVSTRFPFGFFRHISEPAIEESTQDLLVYPKIGKLSSRWKLQQHKTNESLQRFRYRPSRQVGEFLGIRPWQQGDSKKGIHWRASAKHQLPVVRQYELHQNRDCAVILDLLQQGEWNNLQRENFELAVSFTATLVADWIRQGDGTLFFATSGNPKESVYAPLNFMLQDQVLKQLALSEPSKKDNLKETLLMIPLHHASEIIFVTSSPLDIHSSPRFKELHDDSRYRGLLRRFRIIDTSNKTFDEIFSVYN